MGVKKILIVEAWMTKLQHLGVNSGLIEVMKTVYPSYKINYFGEKTQNSALYRVHEDVVFHNVLLPEYKPYMLPLFDLYTVFYLLSVLFRSKKQDRLFITDRLVLAHIFYNLVNLVMRRKTFMVLHGQMEYLVNPANVGLSKYYFWFDKIGFWLGGKHTKYVTLGEPIKQNIVKKGFLKSNQIINIDHPYNYASDAHFQPFGLPLRIGLIGRATKQKHAELIFDFGLLLHQEIKDGKVVVEIVGGVESTIQKYVNKYVVFPKKNGFLSDSEYYSKIEQLHYVLCFFDANNYKAIPSGTFFDAIKFAKPLLMLQRNDFMDYYHHRFPYIAASFEDCPQMAEYVKKLVGNVTEFKGAYAEQISAIANAKEQLSNSSIITSFQNQLDAKWN
ncbi:hypothetical protein FACS189430_06180 [Bacteroidia bacterium]|nr:hypothetical protein FACS189430_06180 [Bacteroidia bacterium]